MFESNRCHIVKNKPKCLPSFPELGAELGLIMSVAAYFNMYVVYFTSLANYVHVLDYNFVLSLNVDFTSWI